MYRYYAELPGMRARLEKFSLKLDAHIRTFIERDRVSNLHNGPALFSRGGTPKQDWAEDDVKLRKLTLNGNRS
jgi:hypothetical protein